MDQGLDESRSGSDGATNNNGDGAGDKDDDDDDDDDDDLDDIAEAGEDDLDDLQASSVHAVAKLADSERVSVKPHLKTWRWWLRWLIL